MLRTLIVTFVPQHASNAVGVSNVQPVPHSSVLGPLQLIIGGFVSISVTICVQNEEFEQQSVACHVSVMFALQGKFPFVIALNSDTTTVEQQLSVAVGGVGVHPPPGNPLALTHTATWFVQKITGGIVSTMETKFVHNELFAQQSVACQTAVTNSEQVPAPFVVSLTRLIVTFVPQHASIAVGRLRFHAVPHCTV